MPASKPSPELTAKVSKWNTEKGYGWLQCGDRDVFLHVRDYHGKGSEPQVGETVRFTLGEDSQGRPCAQNAVSLGGKGLRWPARNQLVLIGLLILPVLALHHLHFSLLEIGLYGICISLVTYNVYASDKRRAQAEARRIPEIYLHALEMIGGWPGAWMAQRRLRHKSSKLSYQIKFWLIIIIHQFVALDSMIEWRLVKSLVGAN
ncbi:DUF1294 domain-containing protein [Brevifollis gellanilyticus]|nr:DUF1294 domain-containing protein [Brevifollis gellanilyticus]